MPYGPFPSETSKFAFVVPLYSAIVVSQIDFSSVLCVFGSLCPSFRTSGTGYLFDPCSTSYVAYCSSSVSVNLDDVWIWCLGVGFLSSGKLSFLWCRFSSVIACACAAVVSV